MNDGYLSKDRNYQNAQQQSRRKYYRRIDYMPSKDASEIINAKRSTRYPLSINSGVIDAIVIEWANLTGIKYGKVAKPMTSARSPELSDACAHANDFGLFQVKSTKKPSAYCGAKTKSGKPCRSKKLPNKNRCKWHGGCSTGPKTLQGKAKALANLKQYSAIKRIPC